MFASCLLYRQKRTVQLPPSAQSGRTFLAMHSDAPTLVPPASTHVCVLHRDGLPPTIDLAYDTGADASALGLINIAMYVELRMHHGHVRCQQADIHNWRL